MTGAHCEVYKDKAGEWRWRRIAQNGEIIAVSSEGYVNRADCVYSVEWNFPGNPWEEVEIEIVEEDEPKPEPKKRGRK